MTTLTTTSSSAPADTAVTSSRATEKGWAALGLVAGVAGIGSMVGSSLTGAVYDEKLAGDAPAIMERLSEMVPQVMFFHTATMVSAAAMVVFAVGLHRQLAQRVGRDSLLPGIAAAGLGLVAVAQLMGAGLTTEFVFGVGEPGLLVPETAAFFGHWIGTIPWLWGSAGMTALAITVAARRGAYPRWLGITSAVLGGLTLLFFVSPLQYMAGMTGPIWLTVAAAGLLFSRHDAS